MSAATPKLDSSRLDKLDVQGHIKIKVGASAKHVAFQK